MPSRFFYVILFTFSLLCAPNQLSGQSESRITEIEKRLDLLKESGMPLDQPVTITFDGPLKELLVFLGEAAKLNLTAAPEVQANVSVSFNGAPAKDIILYLCSSYRLDFNVTGNILEFVGYVPPVVASPPKEINILYNPVSDQLTINLNNDTLQAVARKLAELTSRNVIVDPVIRNVQISGFVTGVNLENALQQLAVSNYLAVKNEGGYYSLFPSKPAVDPLTIQNQANVNNGQIPGATNITVQRLGSDKIAVTAVNANVVDIVRSVAAQLGVNYYLLPDHNMATPNKGQNAINNSQYFVQQPQQGKEAGGISLSFQNISFSLLLDHLFRNTEYGYRVLNGIYLIGKTGSQTLIDHRIYTFQNRSARGIVNLIPEDLLYDVAVDTMMELNSLIVSGPPRSAGDVVDFCISIDKLIPVVLIEVIVLDVQTDKLSDYGVEAGIAGGVKPGGSVISSTDDKGGVNFNFSPGAVNNVLSLLDGLGVVNIGRVNSNFYLSLKAVQEDGVVDVKSTPKLSTLNSHKATLSIGQKRYFQEQQVNFPGTDRPIPVQANVYREVEANLDIEITPVVSGDEQVTLDIRFKQSEFIGQTPANAPPPQVKREFESMIRVRNGEMIILGGLERESKSKNRRGLPWLSKIPFMGWLFGRTEKSQSKGKLMIFIKPTIVN